MPTAAPRTAATIGTSVSISPCRKWKTGASSPCGGWSRKSRRSLPAVNTLPRAEISTAPTSSFDAVTIASASVAYIATVSAFFLTARSRTTCRTPSRSVTDTPREIIGRSAPAVVRFLPPCSAREQRRPEQGGRRDEQADLRETQRRHRDPGAVHDPDPKQRRERPAEREVRPDVHPDERRGVQRRRRMGGGDVLADVETHREIVGDVRRERRCGGHAELP